MTASRYLLAALVVVVAEVVVATYWWRSEGWDCGIHCSTAQQATGWAAGLLPILAVGLLAMAIVRWFGRRRNADERGA